MSAEIELLALCARTKLAPNAESKARLLLPQIDWPQLLPLGARHRVLPLLYRNICQIEPNAGSEIHRGSLASHFLENAARSITLVADLSLIAKTFEREHVRAIPFKGVALATEVYGNPALRETGDLDFLIRKKDLPRGKRVLESLGYRLQTPINPRGTPIKPGEYEYHFEQHGKTAVELRWRITQGQFASALDFDFVWPRCRPLALGGSCLPSMAPEDLLLILCVHAGKHRWGTLMWMCDVAELIRKYPDLNWKILQRRAKQMGLWRVTGLGLILAAEVLDVPIPGEILSEVRRDAILLRLASAIASNLFDPATKFSEPHYHSLIVERRWDDLCHLVRNLPKRIRPNERDRSFCPLPDPLKPAHYLIRPLRILYEQALVRVEHH